MPVRSPKFADDPALIALGAAIRRMREAQKLSQESLALRSNIDRSYMSSIERGQQNPGVMLVRDIAIALDVSIAQLFDAAQL
ncbi:MAG: XRE family transcriptional regulator [Alphaproteobacteria bacterium]|nr:MAG: XRE family transcriptional regulator [Alphaproteobacteria bacterium]